MSQCEKLVTFLLTITVCHCYNIIVTNRCQELFTERGIIMTAFEVKAKIVAAGLHCYQIANVLGITDTSFSRKMRQGLSDEDTKKILSIIEQLKSEAK